MTGTIFLQKVAESLGLTVVDDFIIDMRLATEEKDEEGDIVINSTPITGPSDLPFVIPTSKVLKDLYVEDEETGNLVLQYLPFNCVGEDTITGKSEALSTCVKYIQANINSCLYESGLALIKLLQDDSPVKNKSIGTLLEDFVDRASEIGGSKTKNIADSNTVSLWNKIFKKVGENYDLYSTIQTKVRGKIGDKEYARVVSMSFPLLEELDNVSETDMKFLDIKLRPKDLSVLRLVFTFLIRANADFCVVKGSNHNNFPTFEAVYELYLEFLEKFIAIKTKLTDMIIPDGELTRLSTFIKAKDLNKTLTSIYKDILDIPSEKELLSTVRTEEKVESRKPALVDEELPRTTINVNINRPRSPRREVEAEVVEVSRPTRTYQQTYVEEEQTSSSADALNRLFGGYSGYGSNVYSGVYVNNNGIGRGYSSLNEAYSSPSYGSYNSYGSSYSSGRYSSYSSYSDDSSTTYRDRMNDRYGNQGYRRY